MASYGICFHRDEPAADVIPRARAAEAQGYDEFWVIEDCFFTAGTSLAAEVCQDPPVSLRTWTSTPSATARSGATRMRSGSVSARTSMGFSWFSNRGRRSVKSLR